MRLPPAVSRFARKTGELLSPPAERIMMRPTGIAAPPKSANAATGVRTETGSPRKVSKFPLSKKPFALTVRTPSMTHATVARPIARFL